VHDVFKGRHGGVCVGGKVEGGAVKPGSKVLLVPGIDVGSVKSIELNGQVNKHEPAALATSCSVDSTTSSEWVARAMAVIFLVSGTQ
jgi:translation elongation factor EF-1alpha